MSAAAAIILGLGSAFALAFFCLSIAYPSGRFLTLWSEIPEVERTRYRLLRFNVPPMPLPYRWLTVLAYLAADWINGEHAKRILPPGFRHVFMRIELCLLAVFVSVCLAYGVVWSGRVLRGAAGERGPHFKKIAGVLFALLSLALSAWAYLLGDLVRQGRWPV